MFFNCKKSTPRSSGSQSPPVDASIQELPRTTLDPPFLGFHSWVLACPFQLCRTTHRPRPRSHWIYGWPSGRSALPVEFCRPWLQPPRHPPLGFCSTVTIRTTRTSNLLQHPLPTPPLFSPCNKTFNFLCRRSLITKTNFSLSLDCLQQKVTSVRKLSHFLVIPTLKK